MTLEIVLTLLGFAIGSIVGYFFAQKSTKEKIKESKAENQELLNKRDEEIYKITSALKESMKESFGALSKDALSTNTTEFFKIAEQKFLSQTQANETTLETKKKLIDTTLLQIDDKLKEVTKKIEEYDKEVGSNYSKIATQLNSSTTETEKLREVTYQLKNALASTKARGQWGERMAEDILNLIGFIEGKNYMKQCTMEDGKSRPDYTFILPNGLKVNMDVKFPMSNYLKYIETSNETEKNTHKTLFIKDVRQRITEVTTKDYINENDNTLDYVLVFIPNEQVYSFINENDADILDNALQKKVIICSPFTLYAILSVIRQSTQMFKLERRTNEIAKLIAEISKQWTRFKEGYDKLDKAIDSVQKTFNDLRTTRTNQLDKQFLKIENMQDEPETSILLQLSEEN